MTIMAVAKTTFGGVVELVTEGPYLLATFRPTSCWPGKTLTVGAAGLVVEGYGPISAADVKIHESQRSLRWTDAMLGLGVGSFDVVAAFGPSTAWVGKTLTMVGYDIYLVEGVGVVSAEGVMSYERQGHLDWRSIADRNRVSQVASWVPPPPEPPSPLPARTVKPRPARPYRPPKPNSEKPLIGEGMTIGIIFIVVLFSMPLSAWLGTGLLGDIILGLMIGVAISLINQAHARR